MWLAERCLIISSDRVLSGHNARLCPRPFLQQLAAALFMEIIGTSFLVAYLETKKAGLSFEKGNPAILEGPVAFRPHLAMGLACSIMLI